MQKVLLIPKDPRDEKNVILEIRARTEFHSSVANNTTAEN